VQTPLKPETLAVHFKELSAMFNRSWEYALNLKNFFYIFCGLLLSGLLFFLFQLLGFSASSWLHLPLKFIPFSFSFFIMIVTGALLLSTDKREIEHTFKFSFAAMGHIIISAAYLAIPLLLAFIILWVLLGIFILIKAIPYVGKIFGVFLSFLPFIVNLAALLLGIIAVVMLFFLTPVIEEKGNLEFKDFLKRFSAPLFEHCVAFVTAVFPVWAAWLLARHALFMTLSLHSSSTMFLHVLMVLVPFAAFLTIPVIFFFNFSREVYQWQLALYQSRS
jgi:hypothetical protein